MIPTSTRSSPLRPSRNNDCLTINANQIQETTYVGCGLFIGGRVWDLCEWKALGSLQKHTRKTHSRYHSNWLQKHPQVSQKTNVYARRQQYPCQSLDAL